MAFEPEPGFESFADSCRELGAPVRVGRWKVPGRPRTILIEFSKLRFLSALQCKQPRLTGICERWRLLSRLIS